MQQPANFSLDFIEDKIMILGRAAMLSVVIMMATYLATGQLIPGVW